MLLKYISFIGFFILCGNISAQNFYDQNVIQKIEIQFTQTNWDYQLDTAKAGAEGYIMAASVTINGVYFDSVGVKYKGNSSYNPTYIKNPLHIELDGFKNQSYLGIKDIKLGNNYADPSMIREVLGYDILKNYMHCPQANFAKVYINGAYNGVYSNAESIDKQFYAKHYYSSGNTAVKCNPVINPSSNTKSNLKHFTTGDSSNYYNYYEIKSKYGWNNLRALADTVTNYQSKISSNIDMDRAIWMLAFNNVMVNLDSYSGAFCQNYYLYKDNSKHYNPTIWDLNMCFGGFPYLGVSNSSLAQLSITNLQQLPITIHATDVYWPLINSINSNAQYKRMLVAHMRTITKEFIANSNYITRTNQFQTLIDTSVLSDNNKFYTYSQFQNGLTTNVSVGSYSVPGISNLMASRASYLSATPDFTYTTPSISTPTLSNSSPNYNSTVTVISEVLNTNSTAVYLGYRYNITDKFTRVLMYDDGLHNDDVSGDNIYGIDIPVLSGKIQYYIYAENNNAGMFSPERSEHEYYSINASATTPSMGDLVINEFLAYNTLLEKDEYSDREDWIELLNTSNVLLDLSNVYLSDNALLPMKWKFPSGTTVNPNSYIMIWADDDSAQVINHTNFVLNNSGEKIILSVGATIIDSITFGAQGANITVGRCPNGTGSFGSLASSSFNEGNCTVGLYENIMSHNEINVNPNPATDEFTLSIKNSTIENSVEVRNTIGQLIYSTTMKNEITINTNSWASGIYFVHASNSVIKLIITK